MKGIVFTEFLEMVEHTYGYAQVDQIIEKSDLASKGVYTAVGTYEHQEMVQLITHLSTDTSTPVPNLLRAFGQYIFGTFLTSYPAFFEATPTAFDFLESIEHHIHVEVRKLYPDAQLPNFETRRLGDNQLEMIYTSDRHMSDFAFGLIEKTMAHYQEKASISTEAHPSNKDSVIFLISKI